MGMKLSGMKLSGREVIEIEAVMDEVELVKLLEGK